MTEKGKGRMLKLPVLALRGMMVFPHMVLHFDVGRSMSIRALKVAMEGDAKIFLTAQKDEAVEEPVQEDLYTVGTIATVKQVLNLPGDVIRVMVEGERRGRLLKFSLEDECPVGVVSPVNRERVKDPQEMEALFNVTRAALEDYATTSGRLSQDTLDSILEIDKPDQFADVMASAVLKRFEDRQHILETLKTSDRLMELCLVLQREKELAEAEKSIQGRIKSQVEANQKDYYLREQIKAIQAEIGDGDNSEVEELRARVEKTPLNPEAREKVLKELDRLSRMAPGMPEIGISLNWVEWILDLPWGKVTEDQLDLKKARKVLDEDHYGLEKVKDRIIEYLAVLSIKKDMKGPILCFVGPPGVGKTSVVRSIARAVGREFVQMSLGGVTDESEIRGHRRTYIGAIPGRIISGIRQAKTMNPVFLFDEIDKLGNDFRGDPASALLEVLDAEQNCSFRDRYLELPFDLSRVMFITTANSQDTIPPALLDRMEIIEIPSYTDTEKLAIAKRHLLPKQTEAHGLTRGTVKMTDRVLSALIDGYTREAGVRTLERTIGSVVRKAAVEMLTEKTTAVQVNAAKLTRYLGGVRFTREAPEKEPLVGVVNGLAYTTVGGEMLTVECTVMKGTGVLQLTGKLGDVMQESAKAALSWVRANGATFAIPDSAFKENDIHIHVPEGAVPKDGPSAGVTLIAALVSALSGIPVRQDVAMTGEITLRGRVLPIGGLREKMMAAYRAGIHTLLIPEENQKDLEEVDETVRSSFTILPVKDVLTVLEKALTALPELTGGECLPVAVKETGAQRTLCRGQ